MIRVHSSPLSYSSERIRDAEQHLIDSAVALACSENDNDLKELRVAALKYAATLTEEKKENAVRKLLDEERTRCPIHGFRGCGIGC